MITFTEKIPTTEEELNSVNQNERLSLSEQLQREWKKQKPGAAAMESPYTDTIKEVELRPDHHQQNKNDPCIILKHSQKTLNLRRTNLE